MLMRPEALRIFRRLDEDSRLEALDALKASVIEMGGDSARAYRTHGSGDPAALLATVAATAPEGGGVRPRCHTAPPSLPALPAASLFLICALKPPDQRPSAVSAMEVGFGKNWFPVGNSAGRQTRVPSWELLSPASFAEASRIGLAK